MPATLSRNRFVVAAILTVALLVGLARPSSAFLDKTRFAAHLGVAYFCFHHFVLQPYQLHKFDNGAEHRTSSIVKGGAALLFAVHEVQVAQKIAHESRSPLLHKLDGKLVALAATFATAGAALKSGHFDPKSVDSLTTSTNDVSSDAQAAGQTIKDVPVAIPG